MSTCNAAEWLPGGAGSCRGALNAAEVAFRLLTTGPGALAVDGRVVGHGLPRRPVPLDELRDIVTRAPYGLRDAVWVELVRAAQTRGSAWLVGAVGVALPRLRRIAAGLAVGYRGDVEDLDAEVLTGFCAKLTTIDPAAGRLLARLYWAAQRAGAKLRHSEAAHGRRFAELCESAEPPQPSGHPDLVLAEAVTAGTITALEAEVIGRTRLEGVRLGELAAELGLGYRQLHHIRHKAEHALVRDLIGHGGSSRLPKKAWKNQPLSAQ